MTFVESDIKFDQIDWKQFQELCFDLLVKHQFHSLVWRQGGSDKGRDIQCVYTSANAIVGPYSENWFIECKHYNSGIPMDAISSKIEWADAEKADHFLLITNSYLTQGAREWIEKKKSTVSFRIHILEEKQLKAQLLLFPDLIIKYFSDNYSILIRDMFKQWVAHDILPEPKALFKLKDHIDTRVLTGIEMAFLYFACWVNTEAIEKFCEDEDEEVFDFEFLVPEIAKQPNVLYPALNDMEFAQHFGGIRLHSKIISRKIKGHDVVVHFSDEYNKGKFIDIFLRSNEGKLEYRIASKG